MKPGVFLDTSFLVAFFSKTDCHHHEARQILSQSKKISPRPTFFLSDYIFDEFITFLKKASVDFTKMEQIGSQILSSHLFKMVFMNEKQFNQTWELVKQYSDKEWSFTDASTFILMEEFEIPYYLSYDAHFRQYPKISEWNAHISF